MGIFQNKYLIFSLGALVVIAIITYFVFDRNTNTYTITGEPRDVETPLSTSTTPLPLNNTEVALAINKNVLSVTWVYLPEGTTEIRIFRAKIGTDNWSLWKRITVPSGTLLGGNTQIVLGTKESTQGYYFRTETGSNSETTSWTSSSTQISETSNQNIFTPSATPTPSPTPTSTNQTNQGTTSSTNTVTPTATSSSNQNPNEISYYSPSGELTGTSTTPNQDFWVVYVNKKITIGWQNLPAQTDKIIVYRSSGSNGPWSKLLEQNNPPSSTSGSVGLLDLSTNEPHYYRMDALFGSQIVANYGPVLLPKLE